MKRKNFVGSAAALVSSMSLLAQTGVTPPNPPTIAQIVSNRVARLTALLSLSSSQQTSATSIFTTEETSLPSVRTSIRTARTALQTAVEANDASGIGTAASTIGT